MEKDFKIKKLSTNQIIISIDRLTRFKETEEKYLRVFKIWDANQRKTNRRRMWMQSENNFDYLTLKA